MQQIKVVLLLLCSWDNLYHDQNFWADAELQPSGVWGGEDVTSDFTAVFYWTPRSIKSMTPI